VTAPNPVELFHALHHLRMLMNPTHQTNPANATALMNEVAEGLSRIDEDLVTRSGQRTRIRSVFATTDKLEDRVFAALRASDWTSAAAKEPIAIDALIACAFALGAFSFAVALGTMADEN
jgi:hypothetical protein